MKTVSSLQRQPGISVRPRSVWYLPVKSLLDFVLGAILLVVLSPVIFACAALVKLTSKGPAFYLQTRVGKDGRLFSIIKLRSMFQDAEAGTGAVWSTQNDSRITPIGRILRSTHLDEFPQLINVVKGDMSLVGPRPERPEFVRTFELQIDSYSSRLLVRPGITGIAQLRLPADTDLQSVREKLEFDLYYVRHLSLWLDMISMIATGVQLISSLAQAIIPGGMWIPTQDVVRSEMASSAGKHPSASSQPAGPHATGALPARTEPALPDAASSGLFSAT